MSSVFIVFHIKLERDASITVCITKETSQDFVPGALDWHFYDGTHLIWNWLLVPRWSRSWQRQAMIRASFSVSVSILSIWPDCRIKKVSINNYLRVLRDGLICNESSLQFAVFSDAKRLNIELFSPECSVEKFVPAVSFLVSSNHTKKYIYIYTHLWPSALCQKEGIRIFCGSKNSSEIMLLHEDFRVKRCYDKPTIFFFKRIYQV